MPTPEYRIHDWCVSTNGTPNNRLMVCLVSSCYSSLVLVTVTFIKNSIKINAKVHYDYSNALRFELLTPLSV